MEESNLIEKNIGTLVDIKAICDSPRSIRRKETDLHGRVRGQTQERNAQEKHYSPQIQRRKEIRMIVNISLFIIVHSNTTANPKTTILPLNIIHFCTK